MHGNAPPYADYCFHPYAFLSHQNYAIANGSRVAVYTSQCNLYGNLHLGSQYCKLSQGVTRGPARTGGLAAASRLRDDRALSKQHCFVAKESKRSYSRSRRFSRNPSETQLPKHPHHDKGECHRTPVGPNFESYRRPHTCYHSTARDTCVTSCKYVTYTTRPDADIRVDFAYVSEVLSTSRCKMIQQQSRKDSFLFFFTAVDA